MVLITVVIQVALLASGYGCVRTQLYSIVSLIITTPVQQKMAVALILTAARLIVSFNIITLIIMMAQVIYWQSMVPYFLLSITSYASTSVRMMEEKITMVRFQYGAQTAHTT